MITLPEKFIEKIRTLLGADSESFFLALGNEVVTSIRKNPFKPSTAFDENEKIEWCDEGRYLPARPLFIADPLFHAGAYYVQESSSMFLYQVLNQILLQTDRPIKVLDLCAAPGGKSTLINSLLHKNDLLVSNEIIRSRVDILDENLMRWGQPNVFISNNDPKDFSALTTFFDIILVDAPCSGEGMFRKDKNAINEWSESNVELCAGRQQRIIEDVIPALKPGGFLIYSTCTFNEKENEENVKWMMDEFGLRTVKIEVDKSWQIETLSDHPLQFSYRFFPHKVKGEGLFISVLQKPDDIHVTPKYREQKLTFVQRKNIEAIKYWLNDSTEMEFIEWNKNIHAIRKDQVKNLSVLAKYLHLKNAGILMGELMNDQLLPSHYLALSTELSNSVKSIDITKEQAIKYLRKDTLVLNEKYEQGIYLLKYEGLGIGWVKVLQNRINNYLPTHLRILKEV